MVIEPGEVWSKGQGAGGRASSLREIMAQSTGHRAQGKGQGAEGRGQVNNVIFSRIVLFYKFLFNFSCQSFKNFL
jgi:hypothetical protein